MSVIKLQLVLNSPASIISVVAFIKQTLIPDMIAEAVIINNIGALISLLSLRELGDTCVISSTLISFMISMIVRAALSTSPASINGSYMLSSSALFPVLSWSYFSLGGRIGWKVPSWRFWASSK